MIHFHGEYGTVMFRKFLHSYSKGYQGANNFREIINSVKDYDVMRDIIETFF